MGTLAGVHLQPECWGLDGDLGMCPLAARVLDACGACIGSSVNLRNLPMRTLQMESVNDPAPNKKTRMGYLSDGKDTIKAVFASEPSALIFDGKIVAGTVIKLLDFTPTFAKDKWALCVTRLEVVEATDAEVKEEEQATKEEEQATTEADAAAAPADDAKEDVKMEEEEQKEEAKEEAATEDAKMEEAKTEDEAKETEEDEPEGRPAKVRIMEEKDGNRPVASPAPAAAKPAAEASPKSAAPKPSATPTQSAPKTGTKENVTPKSG